MSRFRYACFFLSVLGGLIAGCAQRDLQPNVPNFTSSGSPVSPVSVDGEKQDFRFRTDTSSLGNFQELQQRLPHRLPETTTRDLLPEETESLAAANSKLADLTELERQAVAQAAGNHRKTARLASLQQQLLCLRAIHERNQSASQALQAFYHLAEVRGNGPFLEGSLTQLGRLREDLRLAKEQGVKVSADATALDRKQLKMQDQQQQAELADAQLSEQLRGLIGLSPGEPTRLLPQPNLRLSVDPIDLEAAISVGLQTRADLAALRLLLSELDTQTLPAARSSLSQTDPGLGVPAPSLSMIHILFKRNTAACELEIRRAQLSELLETREQQIASEIRLAVREIETHLKQAALATETLASWQRRLGDLQALREVGSATPLEINETQFEIAAAESALLKQVVAVRLAEVKLKEAQGLLAAECGYDIGVCLAGIFCP